MEITEIRVALREPVDLPGYREARGGARPGEYERRAGERRLKAYVTIIFDQCFVVRNVKIIEGKYGLFVAMPSRKPKLVCPGCHFKVEVGGRYCMQCGTSLPRPPEPMTSHDPEGFEAQAHRDIAHPITAEFRETIQSVVLEAYEKERTRLEGSTSSDRAES